MNKESACFAYYAIIRPFTLLNDPMMPYKFTFRIQFSFTFCMYSNVSCYARIHVMLWSCDYDHYVSSSSLCGSWWLKLRDMFNIYWRWLQIMYFGCFVQAFGEGRLYKVHIIIATHAAQPTLCFISGDRGLGICFLFSSSLVGLVKATCVLLSRLFL